MSDESSLASQVLELAGKLALLEAKTTAQETRIAELEDQISQKNKTSITPVAEAKRRNIPGELPDGTVTIRDFYTQKGIPIEYIRTHIERGIDGDLLETTDIPHKNRSNFSYHYLTLEQQSKAIEFFDRHKIKYRK